LPMKQDFLVLARLAPGNNGILDYFCFPLSAQKAYFTFGPLRGSEEEVYCFKDLAFLSDLVRSSHEMSTTHL
jgi:hypothetical protein